MPVNPCYTKEELNHFSIFTLDELDAIAAVLQEVTMSEEMRTAQTYIILWCAESVTQVRKVLAQHIKSQKKKAA
jgi:hypothetical protein